MSIKLPPEALRFKVGDLIAKAGFKHRNTYLITSVNEEQTGGMIEVVVPINGRNDVGKEYSTWFYSTDKWERVSISLPKGLILKRNRVLEL